MKHPFIALALAAILAKPDSDSWKVTLALRQPSAITPKISLLQFSIHSNSKHTDPHQ